MAGLLLSSCSYTWTIVRGEPQDVDQITLDHFNQEFGRDDEIVIVTESGTEIPAVQVSLGIDSVRYIDVRDTCRGSLPTQAVDRFEDNSHSAGFVYAGGYGALIAGAFLFLLVFIGKGGDCSAGPKGSEADCVALPVAGAVFTFIFAGLFGAASGATVPYKFEEE
jgi:hypothetical protein